MYIYIYICEEPKVKGPQNPYLATALRATTLFQEARQCRQPLWRNCSATVSRKQRQQIGKLERMRMQTSHGGKCLNEKASVSDWQDFFGSVSYKRQKKENGVTRQNCSWPVPAIELHDLEHQRLVGELHHLESQQLRLKLQDPHQLPHSP